MLIQDPLGAVPLSSLYADAELWTSLWVLLNPKLSLSLLYAGLESTTGKNRDLA